MLLVDRDVDMIALDGAPYIKRVQRLPDGVLLLISDSCKYEALRFDPSRIGSLQVTAHSMMLTTRI